jgi:outer membrane lipoprotein-sorting protein
VFVATLAISLTAATLGCGLIKQAKNVAQTASVLSDFADRLGKAQTLTYTAEYTVTGGEKVTLVQQPPNAAFLGKDGRFIFTKDFLYLCDTQDSVLTCQKSPSNSDSVNSADSAFVAGIAGPGFVTPELALGLILAAALVPGATVSKSERTIAGQHSLCVKASGLEAAASPGDTDAPRDFETCVADNGVLSSFNGTISNGQHAAIELSSFSLTADPGAFAPPAGAKVVDVNQIQVGS